MNKKEDRTGKWEVKRIDSRTIKIVLPDELHIQGEHDLSLDDVKDLIDVYEEHGPITTKCCRGRTALA